MPAVTAAGQPLPDAAALQVDVAFQQRFWSHSRRAGNSPKCCWLWQGYLSRKGYGRLRIGNVVYGAHRIAWMLANGRWPSPSLMVLHSCDNRACVNPAHLREGTAAENQADIDARGRRRRGHRNGADHWRGGRPSEAILRGGSPISEWHVQEARRIAAEAGGVKAALDRGDFLALALDLGVEEGRIAAAAAGETFAWVTGARL